MTSLDATSVLQVKGEPHLRCTIPLVVDLSFLDEVVNAGERLRSDTRQTVQDILVAADLVLSRDPAATLDEIAVEAGVARTTIHRRFATRDQLLTALDRWAMRQVIDAVDAADPDTAPPYVALYQATANVLRIKINYAFATEANDLTDPAVCAAHEALIGKADKLLGRARAAGVIRADVSIPWARQVYLVLVHEAVRSAPRDADPNAMATLILDTFCHGFG
jgi:AcrR family transcriptional regulator